MQNINNSAENFKTSPLGFLMSVVAKYQAFNQKNYENSNDEENLQKSKIASELLDNLKIELSKTEELKKEPSNEAILVHVIENCDKEEKDLILECVFEYLNLLDGALQNINDDSADKNELIAEYYDVSRLGLILNCYLGDFDNDDFFYGMLAEIAETVKESIKTDATQNEKNVNLCETILEKIQKADIQLSFKVFLKCLFDTLNFQEKNTVYENFIKVYTESLLNKVLTKEVGEEEISKLACSKQIQRLYEKLMIS